MKTDVVTLSSKYQVVIPKAARKKLGLFKSEGQRFRVERVSKDEIVFRKDKTLDDFLGQYGDAFLANAGSELRLNTSITVYTYSLRLVVGQM